MKQDKGRYRGEREVSSRKQSCSLIAIYSTCWALCRVSNYSRNYYTLKLLPDFIILWHILGKRQSNSEWNSGLYAKAGKFTTLDVFRLSQAGQWRLLLASVSQRFHWSQGARSRIFGPPLNMKSPAKNSKNLKIPIKSKHRTPRKMKISNFNYKENQSFQHWLLFSHKYKAY